MCWCNESLIRWQVLIACESFRSLPNSVWQRAGAERVQTEPSHQERQRVAVSGFADGARGNEVRGFWRAHFRIDRRCERSHVACMFGAFVLLLVVVAYRV